MRTFTNSGRTTCAPRRKCYFEPPTRHNWLPRSRRPKAESPEDEEYDEEYEDEEFEDEEDEEEEEEDDDEDDGPAKRRPRR